jgi:predicted dehydrogenase
VIAEQVVGQTGVDMAMYGTLRFANGVVSQIEGSFRAPDRQLLAIVGAEGVIRVHAPWRVDWGGELVIQRGRSREVVPVEEANSYTLQLENFADAAEGRGEPLLGRDDAVAQARVIDALYRAADSGKSVSL